MRTYDNPYNTERRLSMRANRWHGTARLRITRRGVPRNRETRRGEGYITRGLAAAPYIKPRADRGFCGTGAVS